MKTVKMKILTSYKFCGFLKTLRTRKQKLYQALAQRYHLEAHPEGGFYKQTYRSNDLVRVEGEASARYQGEARTAGTSIIYMLTEGDFSAWHTVQSDETWHFHKGAPLLLRIIHPHTGELQEIILGGKDILQYNVPAQHIFSAETLGDYTIVGCTVCPGFDFKDFYLPSREKLLAQFPQHKELIKKFTREAAVQSEAAIKEGFSK
ncbi:MAG: hypothetical protein K0R66_1186 [Gammaproteobacteria bacterium]|jgi:predicted cupin superfamily sugar epimerase|nr:hypothetical protein [Gammaproteobacteria bacterium]